MATRKFLDLEEAAKMVGVTPDSLNELRERREIFGVRDGASWKFKVEDVERLIADRASAEEEGEFAEIDEDPDSILLSEVELGGSDESTSSTIIGGRSTKNSPDSDIQLAVPKHDSDINLDSALSSDIKGGSDVLEQGSGVSPMFDDLDTLDLEMESAADSGIISGATGGSSLDLGNEARTSDLTLGSDALKLDPSSKLAFGDGDEFALGEASGIDVGSKAGGSAIDLVGGDEDGDLVLGGSSHGGDLRAGDSGINLLNPADSGLSLESAPLQLGGSAVESLDLGEDDMLNLDEPAAAGGSKSGSKGGTKGGSRAAAAAPPESDDDFLLTPLEEASAEESDSGSQVIALDEEVSFEEAAPGVSGLEMGDGGGGGLLEDDLGEGLGAAAALSAATLSPAAPQMHAAAAPAAGGVMVAPEPAYSGWNVASLVMCALLLIMTGMMTYDLMRNMWSWNGAYSVNSSLMDAVLSWFE